MPALPDEVSPPPKAQAGSLEYAAEVKDAFDKRLVRFKQQLEESRGDDLVVCMFGCAYDGDQGLCAGCSSADPNLLINLMACTVFELADQVRMKLSSKERFLPPKNQTPYHHIVTDITKQLLVTIRRMQRDISVNKQQIILPDAPPNHIILPSSPDVQP